MDKKTSLIFRITLTAAVAGVLLWQVTTRSLVAYFANSAPEAALSLRSTDAKALLVLAERTLAQIQRPEHPTSNSPSQSAATVKEPEERLQGWAELASKANSPQRGESLPGAAGAPPLDSRMNQQIRRWAELALTNDPLNARALSILGQLAHMAGDEVGVANFLRAAAGRSIRESAAVYWLMRKSFESRDYTTALYCADILLRTRSQANEYVMAVLLHMAENEQTMGMLRDAVLNNPPWRSQFLSVHAQYASDPRAPLELLLTLRDTPAPPTATDLRNYVNALIGRKQYELAYSAWLQFLPPELLSSTGFLFNGSFENVPSGLPFDWVIGEGSGVTIDIVQRPDRDGERALLIEFGYGRVDFRGVQQLTALAPGNYEFNAKYRGDISGKRGLVWRVACAETPGSPIGESQMATGASPSWKDVVFSFSVPDTNCRAQYVRLVFDARMASEQLTSGSIFYDELRIARVKERARP